MDSKVPARDARRDSAIPKLSRLPVLSSRTPMKGALSQQTVVPNEVHTPRLQGRLSAPSLPRSAQPSLKIARYVAAHCAPARGVSATNETTRLSTSARTAAGPSSRGNQQKLPLHGTKPIADLEDEENHDQLGSLDSFRSTSRQGPLDELPTDNDTIVSPSLLRPKKTSRLSLSDRTMESIQSLPSTPKDRRRSSFFTPLDSPMAPPPRPSSSLSRNGSNGGERPGTSDGNFGRPSPLTLGFASQRAPASAKPAYKSGLSAFGLAVQQQSSRRASSSLNSGPQDNQDTVGSNLRSSSPSKRAVESSMSHVLKAPSYRKTVVAKATRGRPSLSSTFGNTVMDGNTREKKIGRVHISTSDATPTATKRTEPGSSDSSWNASSAALRQQIAAAKAAARTGKAKDGSPQDASKASKSLFDIDIDIHNDPFNQASKNNDHILTTRINSARMDGKLNIAAMNLVCIPDEVTHMYDAAVIEDSKVNWAEVVDLTKLIAADNQIERFDDSSFPDVPGDQFITEEDTAGNQFGGLEVLDLHRNVLCALPIGLRRLGRLTSLNLAHNNLSNDALDIVSQIRTLKDLNLSHNALSGHLSASICALSHLEALDLQFNRLLALPEALHRLIRLRRLDVSSNQLTALPMAALQTIELRELDASSNALIGSLFAVGTTSMHATLQSLKIANNSLAALTFADELELPCIRTLDVANNHLTAFPDVKSWTELITLMASDNKIADLPAAFPDLKQLKHVNFASNNIRLIDPAVSQMDSLESLLLASNPLRDKKFLNMSASDIKADLRARLYPMENSHNDFVGEIPDHKAIDDAGNSATLAGPQWQFTPAGALEMSEKGIRDDANESIGFFLQSNRARQLNLSFNQLTAFPLAIEIGQTLTLVDLAGNPLGLERLSDDLSLPLLQELKLNRCMVRSLKPLTNHLRAPKLQILNVTANQLSGPVPSMKLPYPALVTFLAGDNKFDSVTAEALRGLQTVNLMSNNIAALPAEIGLLWDEGLRNFEVRSNAFRMPNHRTLDKGTEATLRWLRNRIPGVCAEPR